MKRIIVLLALLLFVPLQAKATQHIEDSYNRAFCSSVGGSYEVTIQGVRIDCVTNSTVYELDFAKGNKVWEGIGQTEYYHLITGKKGVLVLIVENYAKDKMYVDRAKLVAKYHGFQVETISQDILHLNKLGQCSNPKCKCHKK